MRVTFILPGYPWKPAGGVRVVYEYGNQLVSRGHEVTIVHGRRLSNWQPPPPQDLYHVFLRKADLVRSLLFHPSVSWQPVDQRIRMLYVPELTAPHIPDGDVIVATAWQTAETALQYPPEKGRKFYLIQHYETWAGPKERVDATWLSSLYKMVVSKWLYEKGMELGVSSDEMTHISNGVNHALFRLRQPIEERDPQICMMHSDQEWKGGGDGIKALELLRQRAQAPAIVFFGTMRKAKGLPHWVTYVGNPSQDFLVNGIYNRSTIYLCTSWAEGFALPPAEAMACGCAVVTTDCGGNRDYAEHMKTALVSQARDPESLAKNLLLLLKNDHLRMELAKAGHGRIQEFTWSRSGELMERFLLRHAGPHMT